MVDAAVVVFPVVAGLILLAYLLYAYNEKQDDTGRVPQYTAPQANFATAVLGIHSEPDKTQDVMVALQDGRVIVFDRGMAGGANVVEFDSRAVTHTEGGNVGAPVTAMAQLPVTQFTETEPRANEAQRDGLFVFGFATGQIALVKIRDMKNQPKLAVTAKATENFKVRVDDGDDAPIQQDVAVVDASLKEKKPWDWGVDEEIKPKSVWMYERATTWRLRAEKALDGQMDAAVVGIHAVGTDGNFVVVSESGMAQLYDREGKMMVRKDVSMGKTVCTAAATLADGSTVLATGHALGRVQVMLMTGGGEEAMAKDVKATVIVPEGSAAIAALAVAPDGQVYSASRGSKSISVFRHSSKDTADSTISVLAEPRDLALWPGQLLVTTALGTYVVELTTGKVVSNVAPKTRYEGQPEKISVIVGKTVHPLAFASTETGHVTLFRGEDFRWIREWELPWLESDRPLSPLASARSANGKRVGNKLGQTGVISLF